MHRIYGPNPTPLDEADLWENRLQIWHSIEYQLDSPVAKDIIVNLEEAQSQYASAFQQIRGDIAKVLEETKEILKFWEVMKPWFVEFHQATEPAKQLTLLPPIAHTIFLVWQYSRYIK